MVKSRAKESATPKKKEELKKVEPIVETGEELAARLQKAEDEQPERKNYK